MTIWNYLEELENLKGSSEGGASSTFIAWAESNTLLNSQEFLDIQTVIAEGGILYRKDYRSCRFKRVSEIKDLCDLLQPLDVAKESNESWKAMVEDLDQQLGLLRVKNAADVALQRERIESVPVLPNFTVLGMPGFSYQKEFFPELIEIQSPSSKDTPAKSDDYSEDSVPSYSYNTESPIFGDVSKMGDLPFSPLIVKPGWSCSKPSKIGKFQIPTIQMNFQIPNLNIPYLNLGLGLPSLLISLPPCVAQHIPPMFMPRMSVSLAQLGLGKEMALIEKGLATVNNYATTLSSAVEDVNSVVNNVNTAVRDKVALANGIANEINSAVSSATDIIDSVRAIADQDLDQIFNIGNVSFSNEGSSPVEVGNLLNKAVGNGQTQTTNTLMTVRSSVLNSTDPQTLNEKSIKERMDEATQKVKDKKNTIKESLLKLAVSDWDIVKW